MVSRAPAARPLCPPHSPPAPSLPHFCSSNKPGSFRRRRFALLVPVRAPGHWCPAATPVSLARHQGHSASSQHTHAHTHTCQGPPRSPSDSIGQGGSGICICIFNFPRAALRTITLAHGAGRFSEASAQTPPRRGPPCPPRPQSTLAPGPTYFLCGPDTIETISSAPLFPPRESSAPHACARPPSFPPLPLSLSNTEVALHV